MHALQLFERVSALRASTKHLSSASHDLTVGAITYRLYEPKVFDIPFYYSASHENIESQQQFDVMRLKYSLNFSLMLYKVIKST